MTRNDLRRVLIEALTGAAAALEQQMERQEPTVAEPVLGTGRVALSMVDAAEGIGISRTAIYGVAASGALPTVQIGRRRVVSVAALQAFING